MHLILQKQPRGTPHKQSSEGQGWDLTLPYRYTSGRMALQLYFSPTTCLCSTWYFPFADNSMQYNDSYGSPLAYEGAWGSITFIGLPHGALCACICCWKWMATLCLVSDTQPDPSFSQRLSQFLDASCVFNRMPSSAWTVHGLPHFCLHYCLLNAKPVQGSLGKARCRAQLKC